MKCDRCDNEATTHEVMIKAGKRQERHLCESCAKAEGMFTAQSNVPITQLLNQFITSTLQSGQTPAQPPAAPAPAGTCSGCGTTLAQFRQAGLLGCPECYAAFEAQLSPLLQRAHEGGTHHVGKRPLRLRAPGGQRPAPPGPAPEPSVPAAATPEPAPGPGEVELLRARLAEAVKAERYEEAAAIRDQIRRVQSLPPAQPGGAPPRRASRPSRPTRDDGGKGPA